MTRKRPNEACSTPAARSSRDAFRAVVSPLVLLAGAAALGQEPVSPDAPKIPHRLVLLVRAPEVQADLKLTREQVRDVEALVAEVDLPLWQLRDRPAEVRREKATPLIARVDDGLSKILTTRQIERLDQLLLRADGIRGVLRPKVAGRLRLSPGQIERVRTIFDETDGELEKLRADAAGAAKASGRSRELLESEQRRVLAALSADQRRKLTELAGEPMDLGSVRQLACAAPEFREVEAWINSPPLRMADLRGKVVVVHFYAFGCINCIRNYPWYKGWHAEFSPDEFVLVGIHTPETAAERDVDAVRRKAAQNGLEYAIAVDGAGKNWQAWGNSIWPSTYVIDKGGHVRYWWYGELDWQGAGGQKFLGEKIRELIDEPSRGR